MNPLFSLYLFYLYRGAQAAIGGGVEGDVWHRMRNDSKWEYQIERRQLFYSTYNRRYTKIERWI